MTQRIDPNASERLARFVACLLLSISIAIGTARLGLADSVSKPAVPHRLALLVGCTEYRMAPDVRALSGPANDIPMFAKLLTEKFGFKSEEITTLVGWPDDEKRRPTATNIANAFEKLIRDAEPNSQIVIQISGHGMQLPISEAQTDVLDPSNPEPDGLDEVFLPCDIEPWGDGGIKNVIRDNQFGAWLDQLKNRGAAVWIVFDCCHSGDISRDVGDVEVDRSVRPSELGVPDSVIVSAAEKARQAKETARGKDTVASSTLLDIKSVQPAKNQNSNPIAKGSVTAFFAAQSFETAPELPRPVNAAKTPENYYGLFSYLLTQTLQQSQGRVSYRELARKVVNQYRAERGSRAPTPSFSGDLDKDVIGPNAWPSAVIVFSQNSGQSTLSCGNLAGITPGTILGVHPADSAAGKDRPVLTYVKVDEATPTNAVVESIEFNGKTAADLSKIPDGSLCTVVAQDLGDLRLKLAIHQSDPASDPSQAAILKAALESLSERTKVLTTIIEKEADADLILKLISAEEAKRRFKIEPAEPVVLLQSGNGRSGKAAPSGASNSRILGRYPVRDSKTLASELDQDLAKVFSWQSVWRVANSLGAERAKGTDDLGLQMKVVNIKTTASADHILGAGDRIELTISNEGLNNLWVTLLYLDADCGIQQWISTSIESGRTLSPIRVKVDDKVPGPEGFVLLAVPFATQGVKPDYSFLEQAPFGADQGEQETGRDPLPKKPQSTPFGKMLESIKSNSSTRPRAMMEEPTNPQILSWTWVTVKSQQKP